MLSGKLRKREGKTCPRTTITTLRYRFRGYRRASNEWTANTIGFRFGLGKRPAKIVVNCSIRNARDRGATLTFILTSLHVNMPLMSGRTILRSSKGGSNFKLRHYPFFAPSFRGVSEVSEPGIHNHDREYGFRACAKWR